MFLTPFFQVARSAEHFATLKPLIHGYAYTELFGDEDATCALTSLDSSVEGGHPTSLKLPFDTYIIVLEGSSLHMNIACHVNSTLDTR